MSNKERIYIGRKEYIYTFYFRYMSNQFFRDSILFLECPFLIPRSKTNESGYRRFALDKENKTK